MRSKIAINQPFNWQDLGMSRAYEDWRSQRLKAADASQKLAPVKVDSLGHPTDSVVCELSKRCENANFALYESGETGDTPPIGRFAAAFGLQIAEAHRSAGSTGIVALQVTDKAAQRGYIPYSPRAMNWHTDGYYNPPDQRISAFILHCVRPAADGGVNQLFDPEILYIRLRDKSPDHLRALMHRGAMTIPENHEPDGTLRPVSVGPVFYGDPNTGRLQMRYTARTRSIVWRDDPATRDAEACLRECLEQDDPLMVRVTLKAGQGILNNNVLHNRTGFQDRQDKGGGRLMIRARFHNRVKGKHNGQAE